MQPCCSTEAHVVRTVKNKKNFTHMQQRASQCTCSSCFSPATKPTARATTFFRAPALEIIKQRRKRRLEKGDFTALVRQRQVGYSLERWAFEITTAGWAHTAHHEPRRTLLRQHEQKLREASRTPMVVSQKSPCATSLATFAPMSTPQCMPPRLSLKKNMSNKIYDTEHVALRKKRYFHLIIDDIRRML